MSGASPSPRRPRALPRVVAAIVPVIATVVLASLFLVLAVPRVPGACPGGSRRRSVDPADRHRRPAMGHARGDAGGSAPPGRPRRDVHEGRSRRARSAVRAARRSSRAPTRTRPAFTGRSRRTAGSGRSMTTRRSPRCSGTLGTARATSGSTSTRTSRTRSPDTSPRGGTDGPRSSTPSTSTTGSRSTGRWSASARDRRTTRPTSSPTSPRGSSARARGRCSPSSRRPPRTPRRSRPRRMRGRSRTCPVAAAVVQRARHRGQAGARPRVRAAGPDRTEKLERLRRDQYRALQAVDRAVGRLVDALADTGRLDDALVILTSDNGLLWGEHRWVRKEVPYEEAIRVPSSSAPTRSSATPGATAISWGTSTSPRRSPTSRGSTSRAPTDGACARCCPGARERWRTRS